MSESSSTPEKPTVEWVLPASIPFAELKGKDLEECVYWLFDAMGAKDLEWRIGGTGGGASDGGRDLEAHFYTPTIDDELEPTVWWIECKGRAGTVEKSEVQEAVNNAQSRGDLDYLVVATNTQFSNPTRDWVKEWQTKNTRPKVKLWESSQLERLLSKHPDVVLRLFSEALSIQGQAQAMEARFWNRIEYTSIGTLEKLWEKRHEIEFSSLSIFASIANEFAIGDITKRSWGAALDTESIHETLQIGLLNTSFLIFRSEKTGQDQEPFSRAITYLILCALDKLSGEEVAAIVNMCLFHSEQADMPDHVKEFLFSPIINNLLSEVQDICTEDCMRMSALRSTKLTQTKDEIETYWQRFDEENFLQKEEDKDRYLLLERLDAPCDMGFKVNKDQGCPLFATEPSIDNVGAILGVIKVVAHNRKGLAMEKLKHS